MCDDIGQFSCHFGRFLNGKSKVSKEIKLRNLKNEDIS